MAKKYIHELRSWPGFTWDSKGLAPLLSEVRLRQGLLVGKMRGFGLASRWTATLKVLTEETIKSSAIEGVKLDPENVRSSLARRLGLEVGGLTAHKDRTVDGVVEMMLDATQQISEPLTKERLFSGTRISFRASARRAINSELAHGVMIARGQCRSCLGRSVVTRFITKRLLLIASRARWESFSHGSMATDSKTRS